MLQEDAKSKPRPTKENELSTSDKMWGELLVLLVIVAVICYVAYRSAIHEFQILQKDYEADTDWGSLLNEQLPLVIRDVPASWLGGWTYGKTGNKTWPVFAERDGKRYKVAWNAYLSQTQEKTQAVNCEELAAPVKLLPTFQNWGYDGFSRPWWLPVGTPAPHLFLRSDAKGLEKTRAEWTALVSTDGAPLEIWVAHEGAVPDEVHEYEDPVNPWTATTKTYPWVGDVKCIEIKLRPGNVLLLPRHWWFAVRAHIEDGPALNGHGAWWWQGEFHSITSRVMAAL